MKKTALFLVLLSILLVPKIGLANNEINYFVLENTIFQDDNVETTISITLEDHLQDTISIKIFNKPKTIKKEANFPDFSCIEEEKTYGIDILCDISGRRDYNKTLKIYYESENLLERVDKKYLFQQEIETVGSTTNFVVRTTLPEGMGIVEGEDFLPKTGEISSDGRRVSVYWKETNIKGGQTFSFKIPYEKVLIEDIFVFVIPFIILIIILGYLFIKEKNIPKVLKRNIKVIIPVLKSDEKIVVKSILKYGDGINQKRVVEESGYSKAKVSKVLKSLMERDIIKLKRVGRKNEVFINPKFKDNI